MSRKVPGLVKAIAFVYGLNALLYLLVSGFVALELFFFSLGAGVLVPELGLIDLFGVGVLMIASLILGGLGMANWFMARGLWRGSRLALFFALALSSLSVLSSIGAILAADFDEGFLPVFAFHVFCVAYLGFNKKVRRAFG